MQISIGILNKGVTRKQEYSQSIINLFGRSSFVGYWPLDELSGVTAFDIINGRNGTYRNTAGVLNGITLGQPGIGDGKPSVYFDGANGYCNIYSASLAAAFNSAEGTKIYWVKPDSIFSDGISRICMSLRADVNNRIILEKSVANAWTFRYSAGSTNNFYNLTNTTDWTEVAIRWSQSLNLVTVNQNGNQMGSPTTCPLWVGALASNVCVIGAASTTPASLWKGHLQHVRLLNRYLTDDEIERSYSLNP